MTYSFETFVHDLWHKPNPVHTDGSFYTTPEILAADVTLAQLNEWQTFIGGFLMDHYAAGSNTYPSDPEIIAAYQKAHSDLYYAIDTGGLGGVVYHPITDQKALELTTKQLQAIVQTSVHAEFVKAGLVKS